MTSFGYTLNNRFIWCILLLWNHILIAQTTAKPDLTPTYFKFTPFGINQVKGDIIIKNTGTAPSKATTIALLQHTSLLLWSDKVILPPLAVGESFTYTQAGFQVPNMIPSTIYTVHFDVDVDKLNDELIETNNITALINITIASTTPATPTAAKPDLSIAALKLENTSVAKNGVINFAFDVSNIGTAPSPSTFSIKSYLSKDKILSADDVQEGKVILGNLQANTGLGQVNGKHIATVTEGEYYLIVKVDADNQAVESNEANNIVVSSLPLTVMPLLPDLTLANIKISPDMIKVGAAALVKFDLKNIGQAATPTGYRIGAYLSKTNLLNTDAILIGTVMSAATNIGATVNTQGALKIPLTTMAGTYYLILVADDLKKITESNDNNNTLVKSFQITQPEITPLTKDIALNITTTPARYTQYEDITYKITVTNTGQQTVTNIVTNFDYIEAGKLPYTASKVGAGTTYNTVTRVWSVGTLAAGQSTTLDLVLFPMVKGEDLLLKATVTPTDDKPENNVVTNIISNAIAIRSEPQSGFGIEALYPNPVEDVLNLYLRSDTSGALQVSILNTVGLVVQKTVKNTPKGTDILNLDVTELPEGIYILKLSDEKNRTVVRKFVK
jgi:trimeric autotransporter adhesin